MAEDKRPKIDTNDQGKIIKITFLNYGVPVVFKIKDGLPIHDDDGPPLPSELYAKLFKRAIAIYGRSKKKPIANGTSTKKTKEFLAAQKEAYLLLPKIIDYKKRHKKSNWAEAMIEVLRAENRQALPPNLHKWYQHFRSCGVKFLDEGWLGISYWIRPPGEKMQKQWQNIPDLLTAIRMQGHIVDGYQRPGGEIEKMASARMITVKANELLAGWKNSSPLDKRRIQRELAWVIEQLANCRNEHKKNILSQIEAINGFKDSLDRTNPGAMAARSLAALAQLHRRFEALNIIPAKIMLRKRMLIWEKDRLDILFSYSKDQIKFLSRHQSFFGTRLNSGQEKIILQKIDQTIKLLNTALVSPYWERANGAKERLLQAKMALGKSQSRCWSKLIDSQACLADNQLRQEATA